MVQYTVGWQSLHAPPCNQQLNFTSLDAVLAREAQWQGVRETLHDVWHGERHNKVKVSRRPTSEVSR